MRYLITGGAGFIGSHLAENLLQDGHSVIAIDDLSTGSLDNINQIRNKSKFTFVYGSILNKSLIQQHIKKTDAIFHLAAAVGVMYVLDNPIKSIRINMQGTENVLDICCQNSIPLFIASTSEVYGKHRDELLHEEIDRIYGSTSIHRWSYAATKAIDEFLALAYYSEKGLPITIGRFFNIVGPRQSNQYGMVLPRFCKQALKNDEITVFGSGKQTRSFTYISDAIRAVKMIMDSNKSIGEIFNIGSYNIISIDNLAMKVKEQCKSSSRITHIPYDDAYGYSYEDMDERTPDLNKIEKTIGYKPLYDIDMIIKDTVEYWKVKVDS